MKWMTIALPFVLLFDVLLFINFYNWQQESIYEFEQSMLDVQVNYAIDGAMSELLENGTHIDVDYLYWGNVQLEPQVALDTYTAIMLRALGWADTEQNRQDFLATSVPFFIVAGYDGYYVYSKQKEVIYTPTMNPDEMVPNTVWLHRWTPKIPYTETVLYNSNANGTQIPAKYGPTYQTQQDYLGYTIVDDVNELEEYKEKKIYLYYLDDQYYGLYEYDKAKISNRVPYVQSNKEDPGTYARAKTVIARCLTNACNNALALGLEGNTTVEFYLPADYSTWSNVHPVDSPTILTYVSRNDGSVKFDTVTFGIGGASIKTVEYIICYTTSTGEKCYTWAEYRDAVMADPRGCTLDYVVSSQEEAALKGYYYDVMYQEVSE